MKEGELSGQQGCVCMLHVAATLSYWMNLLYWGNWEAQLWMNEVKKEHEYGITSEGMSLKENELS